MIDSSTQAPKAHQNPLRRRTLGRIGTLVAATTVLAATSVTAVAAADDSSAVSRGGTVPAFYDPPTTLPTTDGALVRTEPMRLGLSLPGLSGPLPGRATRLMFRSTDANGEPVAVTGAYIEPTAPWRGTGPRPLVVQASGTMGQGDQCAPSLALENPLSLNLRDDTVSASVGYENIATYRLLSQGIAVMATDYVGLGTTDRLHTYVGRLDQGHAVLDAARAAKNLSATSVQPTSRVGLYGYSQGGGAVASAVELQPTYAPELRIAGAYVGAPPADLVRVIDGIDGSALAVALAWTINGMAQSRPSIAPALDTYLNDRGRTILKDAATQCVGDGIAAYAFTRTTSLTKQGISLSTVLDREPELRNIVEEQRIGRSRPAAPVRIATGISDDTVPHGQVRQLAVDWCRAGGTVTYEPVPIPDLGRGLVLTNHFVPLITDQTAALSWIAARLDGRPATSNCSALPILP